MSNPDTMDVSELEERLRAALSARAELVQPEHLAPLAPVVELRSRWRSPWVLLATAAVVLLVLGLVVRGFGPGARSDRLAPEPDAPTVTTPEDVGRNWTADDLSSPTRLDLDGDGRKEKVEFLAEPSDEFDGRTRVQTTLTSTGDEAYGVVELGTTIGINALDPIDADSDGDQELVLYTQPDATGPGDPFFPVVLDLRDGLLVQAVAEDAELLASGYDPAPGSATEFYDLVHLQTFRVEDGTLVSTRSRSAFARGNMTLLQPETYVADRYEWTLGDDGVLRHGEPGCEVFVPEATTACGSDAADDQPPVTSESTGTVGVGEQVKLDAGPGITARVEAGDPPRIVVEGAGEPMTYEPGIPDPEVNVVAPTNLFSDGASLAVTSASDPTALRIVVQTGDGLRELEPVGDIGFGSGRSEDGRAQRSWLTEAGTVVTAVEGEDGSWQAWQWIMVDGRRMAALPWGSLCFADVEDPTTGRAC